MTVNLKFNRTSLYNKIDIFKRHKYFRESCANLSFIVNCDKGNRVNITYIYIYINIICMLLNHSRIVYL